MLGNMGTVPPFSSLGRSIEAYQPYAAPPTFPQTNYIQGSSPLATMNPPVVSQGTRGAATVNSAFRTTGMDFLYSRGAQFKKWFKMIATGQVESTSFQPALASTWFNMFNGTLYAAGYPRNLGWSEKVPTLPPEALGIGPNQMAARPQITRNVFTRRSFATAPSIPAKPYNG
jgi:hypothetical protein